LRASRKTSGDRPDPTGIKAPEKHGVRHQPGDTPVPIEKWVHPEQTMMRRSRTDDQIRLS
jgi:hypothetical protein